MSEPSRIAKGLTTVVPTQVIKTVAAAGTPERASATRVKFRSATIIGNKAARTANTGTVYLGWIATNDTQAIALASGETITLEAGAGEALDLYDLIIDVVTAGDGLVIEYS